MNIKPALHIFILQCLLGTTRQDSKVPIREATCRSLVPGEHYCPTGFEVKWKNKHRVCERPKLQYAISAESAEIMCDFLNAYLPELGPIRKEENITCNVTKRGFWLAPTNAKKSYKGLDGSSKCSAMCDIASLVYKVSCAEPLGVICEMETILAREKPVVSALVSGQPDGKVFYQDSRVTLGCSVIRTRKLPIYIHVRGVNNNYSWLFYGDSLTGSSYYITKCGVRITAYKETDIHVHTVTCIVGKFHGPKCTKRNCNCALKGPFVYKPYNLRPQKSVRLHSTPNFVSDQEAIQAKCSYPAKPGSAVRWLASVNQGEHILMEGESGVQVTARQNETDATITSALTLDIVDKCWGDKELLLTCSIDHNLLTECTETNYLCDSVFIRVGRQPLVRVHASVFDGERVLFENSPVNITCSFMRTPASQMVILVADASDSTGWQFDQSVLHTRDEKLKCGTRTSATLELYLNSNTSVVKELFVTCTAGDEPVYPCHTAHPNCKTDGPLPYLKTPDKVSITVNFSRPPNTVNDGTDIVANCTSYHFTSTWALDEISGNHRFHKLNKKDPGVDIIETSDGNVWVSQLTLMTKDRGWVSQTLTLVCYSLDDYDGTTGCLEDYFWCHTISIYIAPAVPYDRMYWVALWIVIVSLLLQLIDFTVISFQLEPDNLCLNITESPEISHSKESVVKDEPTGVKEVIPKGVSSVSLVENKETKGSSRVDV